MLAILLDFFLVGLLLATAFGVGFPLLTLWKSPSVGPAERGLFGIALGLGVLSVAVTVLGGIGLLRPAPLAAVLLVGLAFGWRGLKRTPEVAQDLRERLRAAGPVAGGLAGVVLALAAGIMVVGALSPVTDWDSLMYHLQIPVQFLESGRIHLPQDNLHVAYLGLVHMLYLPLLALGGTAGPALLSTALALLLGVALFAAGSRLFDSVSGASAAILLWGSGVVALVAATPRIDVSLALFLFLAHYALILQLKDEGKSQGGLVVGAALAGIALGVKYQALAYIGPLFLLGVWLVLRTPGSPKERLRILGACGAVFLLAAAPMLLKNIVLLGSPFYPFLTEHLISPWLAEITGSSARPLEVGPEVFGIVAQAREPFNLFDFLFRPEALTVEAEARAYVANPAFLLVPLALVFFRDRVLMALALPALLYPVLILVPFEFTNLRYLLPAIPAFTLVSAEAGRRLAGKVARGRRPAILLAVASVVAVVPAIRTIGAHMIVPDRVRAAVGTLAPEAYLGGGTDPGFAAFWNARNRVHHTTDAEARILFVLEARGLYFGREVLQDNVLTNWPLLRSTGALENCLAGTGITHILMNLGALGYYQSRGMDPAPLGLDAFQEFNHCLDPIFNEGGYVFFRVRAIEEALVSSGQAGHRFQGAVGRILDRTD